MPPSRGRNKFAVSQKDTEEVDGRDLRDPPCASLLGLDSAVELWEPDAQDASGQALGVSNCVLREEASTPQSAGDSLGAGLEAAEPIVLLPGVGTPPESTGEELLDLEEAGAPWIWERYLRAVYLIRSWLSPKALDSTRLE